MAVYFFSNTKTRKTVTELEEEVSIANGQHKHRTKKCAHIGCSPTVSLENVTSTNRDVSW